MSLSVSGSGAREPLSCTGLGSLVRCSRAPSARAGKSGVQVLVTSLPITGQHGSHSTWHVHTQRTLIPLCAWPTIAQVAVTWMGTPGLALWLKWGHVVNRPQKGTQGPCLTSQSRTVPAGCRAAEPCLVWK